MREALFEPSQRPVEVGLSSGGGEGARPGGEDFRIGINSRLNVRRQGEIQDGRRFQEMALGQERSPLQAKSEGVRGLHMEEAIESLQCARRLAGFQPEASRVEIHEVEAGIELPCPLEVAEGRPPLSTRALNLPASQVEGCLIGARRDQMIEVANDLVGPAVAEEACDRERAERRHEKRRAEQRMTAAVIPGG